MSLLDSLRKQRVAPAALWLQFTHVRCSYGLYVFVEGPDDTSFYLPVIRAAAGRDAIPIRCGGKDAVLAIKTRVEPALRADECALFFIDLDLDLFVGDAPSCDSRLFVTETYSFENYLVNAASLAALLDEVAQLPRDDPRWRQAETDFLGDWTSFVRSVLPIMAWIVCVRRAGGRPVLNDVKLSDLIEVERGAVRRRPRTFVRLKEMCAGKLEPVDALHILGVARELKSSDPKTYVRGKFALWWFVRFWTNLVESLRVAGTKFRIKVQIQEGTAVSWLATRVICPRALSAFLRDAGIPAVAS